MNPTDRYDSMIPRRSFLGDTIGGFAAIAAAGLLRDGTAAERTARRPEINPSDPYAPRRPHHTAKADRVLVIHCSGALSHLDTFDYKPELIKRDGTAMPGGAGKLVTFQGENGNLTQPLWKFRPRGKSGKMTSDLLPRIGELADDLCFIHSMTSRTNTHGPGENFISTGFTLDGFPSAGAWTTYALGSENRDLPAFVAIPDPRGVPQSAGNNWGAGFLPAAFQGTPFNAAKPIRNLARPPAVSAQADRDSRELLQQLNREHAERFPGDSELAARIAAHELAARMQLSVPKVTDLSSESAATIRAYGADDSTNRTKADFARNCILARKLIEQGVRFVQLFNGSYAMGEGVGNWDGHKHLMQQYSIHGPILDQPVAALLADLKQRGLFKNTLVLFVTEFGRMPTFQKGASGRDHNPAGFTVFMAGAGVKAGTSRGATDEFGHKAIDKITTVYDLYATVLHLLGLDHEALSYYHNGIERRLTDVHGHVLSDVLA